jgi:hypothetical protein
MITVREAKEGLAKAHAWDQARIWTRHPWQLWRLRLAWTLYHARYEEDPNG